MRQRYTTQTSIRLSTDLRECIDTVCEEFKVTPSYYIRHAVAHNVQSDLKQIQNGDAKIVFV
jgi:predicted DNA-binding protein